MFKRHVKLFILITCFCCKCSAQRTTARFCRAQANLQMLRVCSKVGMPSGDVGYMGKMTKVSWFCRLFLVLVFKALVYSRHSFIVCWESRSIHQTIAGVTFKAWYLIFNPTNKMQVLGQPGYLINSPFHPLLSVITASSSGTSSAHPVLHIRQNTLFKKQAPTYLTSYRETSLLLQINKHYHTYFSAILHGQYSNLQQSSAQQHLPAERGEGERRQKTPNKGRVWLFCRHGVRGGFWACLQRPPPHSFSQAPAGHKAAELGFTELRKRATAPKPKHWM